MTEVKPNDEVLFQDLKKLVAEALERQPNLNKAALDEAAKVLYSDFADETRAANDFNRMAELMGWYDYFKNDPRFKQEVK